MKLPYRLAIGLIVAIGGCEIARGTPYSQLIVFGDSLSDVGNVHSIPLLTYPGAGYWQGRFSNGPVYAERLADGLGLAQLTRSTAGGSNYAYGGAQIAGLGGITGFFINDVNEQIDAYLSSNSVDPDALYVVYAGANNFFNGERNELVPLNQMQQQLTRLAGAGVRRLLVPNLPLLGETPEYNSSASRRSELNLLRSRYNEGLYNALDTLEADYPALEIYRLDVEQLFVGAIADPAKYGLVNVTDQAAKGLEPGNFFYSSSNIVPNPEQYLFWDHVHPTTVGHGLLAESALDLVALPGDHNGDGSVNAADFLVWRNQLGNEVSSGAPGDANGDKRVDIRDFDLWKSRFGASDAGLAPGLHQVPEPTCGAFILWVSLLAVRALRE